MLFVGEKNKSMNGYRLGSRELTEEKSNTRLNQLVLVFIDSALPGALPSPLRCMLLSSPERNGSMRVLFV